MLKCDIIIPVYNAFECLKECIDSVLKMTDFSEAHLILIDDRSPDERIVPLLNKYKKQNPDKITVLKNSKNLGFVKTVNKGMRASKNDVLLLNSDTVVTRGWLKKIRRCAYIDEYVATVTPLSNNATLASVPKMFERNELPEGYSLEKMASLVEKYSMRLYPEIPTAHGFCMYIKRGVLNKVGFFNEEEFGKGYGEENDFSFRCFKYGYRHLLCDDAYVLHKESQSFLDKKKMHDDELRRLHPSEKMKLDIWNQTRDIGVIGKNIELALACDEKRGNILVLIHDFDVCNLGGTTMHVMDLIGCLRSKYNFHVLYPEGDKYKVHSFYKNTDLITSVYDKPMIIEDVQFYSLGYKKMVEKIIKDYGVSYVHIHHLIGHCFSIMDACKAQGVEYAVTIHDYYLVEGEVAVIEEHVGSKENELVDVGEWRRNSEKLLKGASNVFAPSDCVRDVFRKILKVKNISVIEHGVDIARMEKTWDLGDEWNIALVGVMCPHKGLELLDGLVEKAPDNLRIHLFGTLPEGKTFNSRFINHGQYRRDELPELMEKNKIDLVCILSLWPETYSYTAAESTALGLPVLSFDLGAISERVRKHNIGYVIPYTRDGEEVLGKICTILNDKEKYDDVIRSINNYKVRSVLEMSLCYGKIFDRHVVNKNINYDSIRAGMMMADRGLNKNDGSGDRYKAEFFQILNSRKWKMVSKIRVPDRIRRIIGKIQGGNK